MRKKCIGLWGVLSLCLLVSSCGGSNEKIDLEMIPVMEGEKSFFLNRKGKVVLETEKTHVGYFSDGLAIFWEEGGYGYMDKKGKTVIEPRYKSATSFREGIAWVVEENGHPQAINTKGKVLFTLEQAGKVNTFSDGLAVFETVDEEGNTLYGCVNKSGKTVIKPQENEISGFAQGKAVVRSSENGKKGYINKKGETIIACQFDNARDFTSHKYACVELGDQWGIINEKGEYVINPTFEKMIEDGKWMLVLKKGEIGWYDQAGKIIIEPQFDSAFPFGDNDLAPVMKEGKWGYINRKGVVKIPYQFDRVSGFMDNKVAAVFLSDRIGLINKDGKYIVNPQYSKLNDNFLEYATLGTLRQQNIFSDYFDVEAIVNKVKELITDEAMDGIAYTETIGNVTGKYGIHSAAFSKYGSSSVEVKKGKLSGDGSYVIKVNGYPYIKETKGWFPNYVFHSGYVPESYSMVIDLDWKKQHKTEMLFRELFNAFSDGTEVQDVWNGILLHTHGEKIALKFLYNNNKITITTEKGNEVKQPEDTTPLVSLNISGVGKYDACIGKEYAEITELPDFKECRPGTGKMINVKGEESYGLSVYGSNANNIYVVEKHIELPDGKTKYQAVDFLVINLSELPENLHVDWIGGMRNNQSDDNIILIYQVEREEDFIEKKVFTKINQAWRINESTGKFESIPVAGITCRNEGYGV